VALGISGDDAMAYVPYISGRHVALSSADGKERWRTADTSDGFSWPAASDERHVYMAGERGGFVAVKR
jgi:hypothetical protein